MQGGFGGEIPPHVTLTLAGAVTTPLPRHCTGGQRFTDQQPVQLGTQLPVDLFQRVPFAVLSHIVVAAQHTAVALLHAVGVRVGLGVAAQAGTLGQHTQAALGFEQPQMVPQRHALQP